MPKTQTLFPWPGGKTRMLQHLLPLLSKNPHECYVEAFAGGAAVLFAREPAKLEVINDANGELVRLYRVVAHHMDEFVRSLRWLLTSREQFDIFRQQRPETMTDIQRAVRFFYLQRLSFGGKVVGQSFGPSLKGNKRINLLRLEEELSEAHMRLHGVIIENLRWQECVRRYDSPQTLFFFDPPYYETTGYGVEFDLDEYVQLSEAMRSMQGAAILTINDHPKMREVFGGFRRRTVPIRYTVGGGKGVARAECIYTSPAASPEPGHQPTPGRP